MSVSVSVTNFSPPSVLCAGLECHSLHPHHPENGTHCHAHCYTCHTHFPDGGGGAAVRGSVCCAAAGVCCYSGRHLAAQVRADHPQRHRQRLVYTTNTTHILPEHTLICDHSLCSPVSVAIVTDHRLKQKEHLQRMRCVQSSTDTAWQTQCLQHVANVVDQNCTCHN